MLRRPQLILLATVLVYLPMSLIAVVLAQVTYGSGPLWLGIILLGTLPTDVSSPLLVWIGRGNVALATVCNAVNTALAPVLVPVLLLTYTSVELQVPTAALVGQLAATIVLPTLLGVAIRTRAPGRIGSVEPALSAVASVSYLVLLLAVIGSNADDIRSDPTTMVAVAAVCLALNVAGYLVAVAAFPLVRTPADRTAMLFTVSKKEFSIAAVVVVASGLPPAVAIPAALYAVVQMLTSPVVARRVARRASPRA